MHNPQKSLFSKIWSIIINKQRKDFYKLRDFTFYTFSCMLGYDVYIRTWTVLSQYSPPGICIPLSSHYHTLRSKLLDIITIFLFLELFCISSNFYQIIKHLKCKIFEKSTNKSDSCFWFAAFYKHFSQWAINKKLLKYTLHCLNITTKCFAYKSCNAIVKLWPACSCIPSRCNSNC